MDEDMDVDQQLGSLRGVDSLQVVYHRFSDGVEVVKCVLEFCKEVGDVEQHYSNSIHKLLRSSSYSFHSNILMKWLGSDPYQEIGTVRKSWQNLGTELSKLADLHSQKATAYLDAVRKPLQELLPQLEETRQELKTRIQSLRADLDMAAQLHAKENQKYVQLGDSCMKMKEKADTKSRQKLLVLESELKLQESIYHGAHTKLVDAHKQFDEEMKALYKKVQDKEIERVDTLKTSLQQFTKTMSNTAPAYLESFQRIVMSVDEISGPDDIKHFVSDHKELTVSPELPVFERHPHMTGEAVTQFTDMPSSPSVKASASNAAKKLLSRLNFRDNKSISPENSETSVEADQNTSTTESKKEDEESDPVITKRSRDGSKPSDVVSDVSLSNSEGDGSRASRKTTKSVHRETKTPETAATPVDSPVGPSTDTTLSTKQRHGRTKDAESRSLKPTLKVKPQLAAAATAPQRHSSGGDEKTKKESVSPETGTTSSFSSSSSSSSTGRGTNVVQRKQQNSQQISSRQSPTVERASKHTVPRAAGPTYPHRNDENSVPGPVKPRSQRKTAPSSHPARAPPPSSSQLPNTEEGYNSSQLTASLPGLTDCSKEELQLLSELNKKAAANDYYGLLGVNPEETVEGLARARREKTKVLHPDHFANDPERQAKAQEQLARINQIFQDVLKSEETRKHYDQLCRFRQFYVKILQQKSSALETALGKLVNLHKSMKKAQMPLSLLDELQLVQKLIRTRINLLSTAVS